MSENSATDRPYLDFSGQALNATESTAISILPRIPRASSLNEDADVAIAAACESYSIELESLKFGGRMKSLAEARMVTYWLLRCVTKLSYAEIGRTLGGKDHSCAMSGMKKCVARRAKDPRFLRFTDDLMTAVLARIGGAQ